MNYELAKQLKDAGFPFDPELGHAVISPSLSELIEACGDDICLSNVDGYVQGKLSKKTWIAIKSYGIRKPEDIEDGYTAEEAVAKLWLALNKPVNN